MATGRTVKDVSPHEFVKAYSAHLKRSGKVRFPYFRPLVFPSEWGMLQMIQLFGEVFNLYLILIARRMFHVKFFFFGENLIKWIELFIT